MFGSSTSPSPLPLPKLSIFAASIRSRKLIQQCCARERAAAADKSNDNNAIRMIFARITRVQKYFFMKKETRGLSCYDQTKKVFGLQRQEHHDLVQGKGK